ncbi:MAG: hypothetical protein K5839_01525 [Treponemataceae bacterium]|nr:hypothetical protein [Treponemataceae bacterium]
MKKFYALILILVALLSFTSCKKEKKVDWNPETGHVALLFGYGYNEDEFVSDIKAKLSDKFGLAENGGLVLPLVFPQDFSSAGTGRISFLKDFVQENNCKALITLGAPEYTHLPLAKLQDENPELFIISMFSQDDILATEAASNIVLDFVESEKSEDSELSVVGESGIQHLDKMDFLLNRTIKALAGDNMFKEKPASELLPKLYGSDWQVGFYVDSVTGLKSRNHYVLKYLEKSGSEKKRKAKKS